MKKYFSNRKNSMFVVGKYLTFQINALKSRQQKYK